MQSLSKKSPLLPMSTSQRVLKKTQSEKKYQNYFKPKLALKLSLVSLASPKSSLLSIPNSLSSNSINNATGTKLDLVTQKSSPSFYTTHKIKFAEKNYNSDFMHELTDFEKEEIKSYTEIYYVGKKSNKIIPDITGKNMNFDSDGGNYRLVKGDHLAYRFEILSFIGKGSFGVVCECFDHKNKEKVAAKILKNKKSFHRQGTVEINILKALKENDPANTQNVVKIKVYFIFRNHICLITELLHISVYDYLRFNKFQGLKMKEIKVFVEQILQGLSYLESLMIIHCDLKPENLLLTSSVSSTLKIIDFGSACYQYERVYTYIQSRYYRSPEIILGIPYTCAIDMWSLGCIIAELFTGKVLLNGTSEIEQLMLMVELLGLPPENLLEKSKKKKHFYDKDGEFRYTSFSDSRQLNPKSRVIEWAQTEIWDFVSKCLTWDPENRLTPGQGLVHPWLKPRKQSMSKSRIEIKHKLSKVK